MRRVFAFCSGVYLLRLELERALALRLLLLKSIDGEPVDFEPLGGEPLDEAASPQCQLIAVESGAFLNLLHGAHPPRHPHCHADRDREPSSTDETMQYSVLSPNEIQNFHSMASASTATTAATVRLPSVHVLLGALVGRKPADLACLCNAGPASVAFDAHSPKQTASRLFLMPPLDVGHSPERPSAKLAKPRRQLSIRDLLCADAATSAALQRRAGKSNHRRQCGVSSCFKYALTGGFCIRHGGGKRCSHAGCLTVAQSGGKCKAHGGGSKCKMSGCGSVARRKGYCMAHGGRQQCKVLGCPKCAHGGGYCISHGGGKRCSSSLCTKSAQAGGFCYSHGGGKRCSAPECFQAARKGGLCIRHRKANESPAQVHAV